MGGNDDLRELQLMETSYYGGIGLSSSLRS